jgi:hypothetical protein
MNKRIQDLAEQARASVPSGLVVEEWIQVYNIKLGQLIVRDVLDEVLQAMDDGMDVYDTVADKFGVEE